MWVPAAGTVVPEVHRACSLASKIMPMCLTKASKNSNLALKDAFISNASLKSSMKGTWGLHQHKGTHTGTNRNTEDYPKLNSRNTCIAL
eukprot:960954-Lingulodinium_polyedra.AAC.1